ncbi:MAG: helix-turn-helix transcriptional regulator [Daejeonella sp.]
MDETVLLKQFGQTVRDERLKLGLSQEALSFECGLDRTYIGGIERGERNVSLVNIVKIANALKIHPSKLLKEIKDEKS